MLKVSTTKVRNSLSQSLFPLVDLTEEDVITQESFMKRIELTEFGEDAQLYAAYLELMRPFERSVHQPTPPKLDLENPETLQSLELLDAEYWRTAQANSSKESFSTNDHSNSSINESLSASNMSPPKVNLSIPAKTQEGEVDEDFLGFERDEKEETVPSPSLYSFSQTTYFWQQQILWSNEHLHKRFGSQETKTGRCRSHTRGTFKARQSCSKL